MGTSEERPAVDVRGTVGAGRSGRTVVVVASWWSCHASLGARLDLVEINSAVGLLRRDPRRTEALDVYAGLFGDDPDSVADGLDRLRDVPHLCHTDGGPVDDGLGSVRVNKR